MERALTAFSITLLQKRIFFLSTNQTETKQKTFIPWTLRILFLVILLGIISFFIGGILNWKSIRMAGFSVLYFYII